MKLINKTIALIIQLLLFYSSTVSGLSPQPSLANLPADTVMDVESSVDDFEFLKGWTSKGDFRFLHNYIRDDARDGSSNSNTNVIARLRHELTWNFAHDFRAGIRLAGSCTSDDCNLDFVMDRAISGSGLERGAFTFDELFLHYYATEDIDIAVGRLQTKLVTRGGVYNKSLDRADSDNANINWTDGAHATIRHDGGWESHIILQHNNASGAGNVRRDPLNFQSSKSRITYVYAIENTQKLGPITQRAFDINYLPAVY